MSTVFQSSNVIFNEQCSWDPVREAPATAASATNKIDHNILPGMVMEYFRNGPSGSEVLGVRRNQTANIKSSILVADLKFIRGAGLDDAYVTSNGTTSALWSPDNVRFRSVSPGKRFLVRFGATSGTAGGFVALAAGGNDGQKLEGSVAPTNTEANAWARLLESVTQTNAHDFSLVWVEKV